ncbi:Sesquipedalian-2, partial [Podiceps cristatus]
MKLNERSVAHYATCDSPADHAGFLRKRVERHHHHAHHHHATSYQRRWFVLKGNVLFYFEEGGAAEESAFAIRFDDAGARAYVLVADGQAAMEAWVKALSRASFDYMRLVVRELEKQLEEACKSLAACRKSPRRASSSGRKRNPPHPASLPPPLPPRRRSAASSTVGSPAPGLSPAVLESPVSPETACFSKLHSWYGQEIAVLRREWQERQERGH